MFVEKVPIKFKPKNKLIKNKKNKLKNASSNSANKKYRGNDFKEVPDDKLNNGYLSDNAYIACNKIFEMKVAENKISIDMP